MDKMFPGFVAYGAPGTSGYAYCNTAPDPTPELPEVVSTNPSEVALPPANVAPLVTTHYEIEIQPQPPSHVKQEQDDKHKPTAQLQPPEQPQTCQAQTQTCQSETQTDTQVIEVPIVPYFEPVNVSSFVEEEKKKVHQQQQAIQAALKTSTKPRNKTADPKSWSSNVRKTKHQRGEAYISRRGKFVPERHVKTFKDCRNSCKLHCSQQLSDQDRQHIFKAFYSLSSNEKKHFLLNTTERHYTKKPTKLRNDDEPKRKFSFKYFFLVRAVRYNVCKAFYLGTLAISQKPIYNVHAFKSDMNLPKPDGRGLAPTSAHGIPAERKERVRAHIASFPVMETSGSSARSKRYLDNDLSVKTMHQMYVHQCNREGITPVKESMYRKIFNTEFNLHFKKGRSKIERCENCKHPIKRK